MEPSEPRGITVRGGAGIESEGPWLIWSLLLFPKASSWFETWSAVLASTEERENPSQLLIWWSLRSITAWNKEQPRNQGELGGAQTDQKQIIMMMKALTVTIFWAQTPKTLVGEVFKKICRREREREDQKAVEIENRSSSSWAEYGALGLGWIGLLLLWCWFFIERSNHLYSIIKLYIFLSL